MNQFIDFIGFEEDLLPSVPLYHDLSVGPWVLLCKYYKPAVAPERRDERSVAQEGATLLNVLNLPDESLRL